MSSPNTTIAEHLSQRINPFGLKLWQIIGITSGALLVCSLSALVICVCVKNRRRYKRGSGYIPTGKISAFFRDIKEVPAEQPITDDIVLFKTYENSNRNDSRKIMCLGKWECGGSKHDSGSSDFSHLSWGHWFTLRDLEIATNWFSKDNVVGEGGYGIVYHGLLINGTPVAIKRLFNNLGQAEKEFRVEIEAIGHVRHKNLVQLLGYCMEGTQRMLVYEYVNNGNLEQWLHSAREQQGSLTWEARMKIISGTVKALAYLHEAVEPKVVHRDIKSSNILIDDDFNAKVSDFGLAKLLGTGKSHITTRVMGTLGYVAPEYVKTGFLNEKSDIYSFGVLLLEAVTGREPVDQQRTLNEVNLVDWIKWMVGSHRSKEVVDPSIVNRPSTKALKRVLLAALRCVDPDSEKRPTMGQVVQMLEPNNPILNKDRRHQHNGASTKIETREGCDTNAKLDPKSKGSKNNGIK